MAKASRDKGKRGELEFEKLLKAAAVDYSRHQDGHAQPADFRVEGFQVECRRREALSLDAWSKEIEAKVPDHLSPAVAYRRNGSPWRVSLLATDFLRLLTTKETP